MHALLGQAQRGVQGERVGRGGQRFVDVAGGLIERVGAQPAAQIDVGLVEVVLSLYQRQLYLTLPALGSLIFQQRSRLCVVAKLGRRHKVAVELLLPAILLQTHAGHHVGGVVEAQLPPYPAFPEPGVGRGHLCLLRHAAPARSYGE